MWSVKHVYPEVGMQTRRVSAAVAVGAVGALLLAACGGGSSGGSGGSSTGASAPYKIGVLIDATGPGADLVSGTKGVQAYVAYVNGNPSKFNNVRLTTVVADDGTTAAGALSGAQKLVQQDHVSAIVSVSSVLYAAEPYLLHAGIPVFGSGFDGPEWNDQANTNMFTVAPNDYTKVYGVPGTFFKSIGVTKCAAVGFSDSPSSSKAAAISNQSCEVAGIPNPYIDLVKFADTDVGPIALNIQKSGADALNLLISPTTGFGIASVLGSLGAKMKSILFADGYGGDLLSSPAGVKAAQGYDFESQIAPLELNTPATQLMTANLALAGVHTDPTFGESSAYGATAALAAGAKAAGPGASPATLITKSRQVTGFTMDGLLGTPLDFASYSPTRECTYIVKLEGNKFVPLSKTAYCGDVVAEAK
jgi:branched-chain amino acid transport system substrate-binding protein